MYKSMLLHGVQGVTVQARERERENDIYGQQMSMNVRVDVCHRKLTSELFYLSSKVLKKGVASNNGHGLLGPVRWKRRP